MLRICMIKRIDFIRNFGIYKNFSWASSNGIKDFNYKNIFYGWNYSGKTTLSRIFSSLRDKKIHDSYTNGTFKVSTDDGIYDSSNLSSFPYDILVFNSDYIKDNLNFSLHGSDSSESRTILFEVGDNAKYETKIIELQNKIDSINGTDIIKGKKLRFKSDIEEFEIYDGSYLGKFTVLAKEIKDEHFLSLINFTKANVKNIINDIKEDLDRYIITDKKKLSSIGEIVKISRPKEELEIISVNLNIKLTEKVNQVLGKIPQKDTLNKILDNNNEVYNWVKEGKELHNPNTKCFFCNNIVTEERFNFLSQYFSSQASLIKVESDKLNQLIRQEITIVDTINFPSSSNDFNLGFINDYTILKSKIDKTLFNYKKHLNNLSQKIDKKINKSLYLEVAKTNDFNIDYIISLLNDINDIIKKNNDFSKNFTSKIDIEREKLKNHLVAVFVKREKYFVKEKNYEKALSEIEKLNYQIENFEKEIKRYISLKESDREGAEQYTYFIQSFLNRDDIEIKLDDKTGKFILLRDKQNASNLSEGEKTAIAFSHFLVSIRALESKILFKDYVVFIDDPISSLDGNHIFQINSLLKEIFFSQQSDPTNPSQNMWKINCLQLYISTHNFEFFNLLKELPKSANGFNYIKDERKCKESRYFIERKINESSINIIPTIFDEYKSEYHFLFSEIVKFNNDPKKNSSDKILLMPNILRRFVEMYTLTKYPSKDEVDDRANKVFGKLKSKRILKPFHYFSHFNNIDRIGKHSELLVDVEKSCYTVIEFLQNDKNHYEALMKSIN